MQVAIMKCRRYEKGALKGFISASLFGGDVVVHDIPFFLKDEDTYWVNDPSQAVKLEGGKSKYFPLAELSLPLRKEIADKAKDYFSRDKG
jgi:hypothetical protein